MSKLIYETNNGNKMMVEIDEDFIFSHDPLVRRSLEEVISVLALEAKTEYENREKNEVE
jgi:hypothetical protein